jgi:hypothetical protein
VQPEVSLNLAPPFMYPILKTTAMSFRARFLSKSTGQGAETSMLRTQGSFGFQTALVSRRSITGQQRYFCLAIKR